MLRKLLRLFFHISFALLMLYALVQHQLIIYALEQGYGQVKLVAQSKPASEVLADSAVTDSVKSKLLLIESIKTFATTELGLKSSKNYSNYYQQNENELLLTVSAAKPFELKAKEWKFPFLGTVSYKGFFNKKRAFREIAQLKREGYDVDVYSPSGWSTLGWFQDPILSGMLKKDDGNLANLIIHELSHGTLYIKNDVDFNENLANFIGDKGAELFLIKRYGQNSPQYISYVEKKQDEKIYTDYILKSTERLDSLYKYPSSGNKQLLKSQKRKIISEIVVGVMRLPLHHPKGYFNYTLQAFQEGNAFFMAFTRYDSNYDLFNTLYRTKYRSDLKLFIQAAIVEKEKLLQPGNIAGTAWE